MNSLVDKRMQCCNTKTRDKDRLLHTLHYEDGLVPSSQHPDLSSH